MKVAIIAALASFFPASNAAGFRELVNKVTGTEPKSGADAVAAPEEVDADADEEGRKLQNGCWTNGSLNTPTPKWHPTYSAGWTNGFCRNTVDCNTPGYTTQLACCQGAYRGQTSGVCLSGLPEPPTQAPTDGGGLDVYYPDYSRAWPDGQCINTRPLPNGRLTYPTMLACCQGAYAGQASGNCLANLPEPPTSAPTNSRFEADFFYPDYDTPWPSAGCSNKLPLPYNNINDRPRYDTQLACCKGAYGGQMSGVCLSQLPEPPTQAPTGSGGLDVYYPDYETPWSAATCINRRPLPNGRTTYPSQLECCKGAYGGQMSGACLAGLPEPPTQSPTESGGLDVFYPDYNQPYASGVCINDRPLPSGRPTYQTKAQCCGAAYGSQQSQKCQCDINPCFSCQCSGAATNPACSSLNCS